MRDIWLAVRWTHVVAMAFFVGGQLLLALVVVPVARRAGDSEQLRGIARRFAWGTVGAVAVLVASGVAMATHYGSWGDGTLQLKLGFVGLVGVLIVWHLRAPANHALEAAIFVISLVIVWLGLTLAHGWMSLAPVRPRSQLSLSLEAPNSGSRRSSSAFPELGHADGAR
jgi:putative copper export protein